MSRVHQAGHLINNGRLFDAAGQIMPSFMLP